MTVRLAFSMFAFFEPDVLVIDEALAVGDAAFQRKCYRRMEELSRESNRAVILVSHDLQSIVKLCDRVYWIDHGSLRQSGEPETVVQEYLRFLFGGDGAATLAAAKSPAGGKEDTPAIPRQGLLGRSAAAIVYDKRGVEMLGAWLENSSGELLTSVKVATRFSICYALRFSERVERPVFGIRLNTTRGECLLATNTVMMGAKVGGVESGQTVVMRWPILPGLAVSDYFISCGCSVEDDLHRFLMREVDGYQFSVTGEAIQGGLCSLNEMPTMGVL